MVESFWLLIGRGVVIGTSQVSRIVGSSHITRSHMTGTGSHVFLGWETADQLEKRIAGSWNRKSRVLGWETADQGEKRSWAHGTGSHVIWKEKPLTSRKNGSWAQDGQKPRRKRGLKVQSPIGAVGVGIKRQPQGVRIVTMSFYITLLSDQAQGTGQKFTARLPRSYYLVEDVGSGVGAYLPPGV